MMMRRHKAEPTGTFSVGHRRRSLSDPLAAALRPPKDETPEQRERRLNDEQEAKRVSDGIDEMIRAEKKEKRVKQEVKVLLLGQSESGKSTTLKQFQLMHTPAAFRADRMAWRAVIYLNLVRSIRRILDAITPEVEPVDEHEDEVVGSLEAASIIISSSGRPPSAVLGTKVKNIEWYRQSLEPLIELEDHLINLLSSPDEDEATHLGPVPPGWQAPSDWSHPSDSFSPPVPPKGNSYSYGRPSPQVHIPNQSYQTYSSPVSPQSAASTSYSHRTLSSDGSAHSHKAKKQEVAVHHTTNWKKAFALGGKSKNPKSEHTGEIAGWWDDPDDPVHIVNACAPIMQELWRDSSVRRRLEEKRLRLEESGGFYLNDISRITAKRYIPTDEDVIKARLKTLGVVEHTFSLDNGNHRGVTWKIYDVGGARNQRQAWAPYFEDVNAIIFLAPISAFDQVLVEDPRVNRLEDCLLLWITLISNKLLADVNIVLFLNKCDLLQAKLNAGVRLKDHMISYGDRLNDYDSVSKYFRNKFGALHQSHTPNRERELFIHLTSVTDTRRTFTIISNVRDIIIKSNLKNLSLV